MRNAHSDNPWIEMFYRQLDAMGMGGMKEKDAIDWAGEACDGNGLVLWGRDNYSMAESFRFSRAALMICQNILAD